MENTPKGLRKHIGIYGKVNAGKSSIMNSLLGQDISLVSSVKGTTTDPVSKAMELIGLGPVVFIDTAGIDDYSELGEIRIKRSLETMDKIDFGIFVVAADEIEVESILEFKEKMKTRKTPYVIILNKIDLVDIDRVKVLKEEAIFKDAIFLSIKEVDSISKLKTYLIRELQDDEDPTLIGDLVPYSGKVILVIPMDSEAPKGRLILPQVQLIRDCLDHGIKSYIVRDSELKDALDDIKDVDLVITDSQIFKEVEKIIPKDMRLTSFSILMARQKGNIHKFIDGVKVLDKLKEKLNPKILIMESCSHNTSHEDIGRVKIPNLLKKYLEKDIEFTFKMGADFPKHIENYDLVIHCGSCMFNRKAMLRRIDLCVESRVSITNYGIVLAHLAGILDRSTEFLTEDLI